MLWWLAVKKGAAATWAWLKKYWMWLILPVGVLVYLFGKMSGAKSLEVVTPELVGASETKDSADEKAKEERAKAKEKLERIKEEALREHTETIEKLNEEQREHADELVGDPDKLNDFLLEVGRSMRSG
jgi:biopolymer transport protein ExbB/TolQ